MYHNPIQFSKEVAQKLSSQGWDSKEHQALDKVKKTWQKNKYEIFEAGIIFAKYFNNIRINHEAYKSIDSDYSIFEAIKATNEIDFRWISEDYENRSLKKLLPIGQGYSEHLTYLISEDYHIYGAYDDYFCLIGTSINDFFENIFFKKNFTEL